MFNATELFDDQGFLRNDLIPYLTPSASNTGGITLGSATNPFERIHVNEVVGSSTADLLIGAASTSSDMQTGGLNPQVTVVGTSATVAQLGLVQHGANTAGATIEAFKTRGTGTDANTIAVSGDSILAIVGYAADGANYKPAARINMKVGGTPGTADMPGQIDFDTTADGAATLLTRASFLANGDLSFDGTSGGNILLNKAGTGLQIKSGVTGRIHEVTLSGGTVTVLNTGVTANTKIFLSRKTIGGTVGNMSYVVNANTSYVITSSSNTDTSVFEVLLIEAL